MNIKDFSGGERSRVHPTLILPTESQVYLDCDNEAGILRPVKEPVDTDIQVEDYFTHFDEADRVVSSQEETYWVNYRSLLYSVSNNGAFKETVDGTVNNLGIEKPTLAPNISAGGLSGLGTLNGTYSYAYTYYNEYDGAESAPSTISVELDVVDNSILISNIVASSDPQVTAIRLYRIGGTLTNYSLVTELAVGTLFYNDNNSDESVAGNNVLDSYSNGVPPTNLKYLTEAYAMLFASVDDKLYFSNIADPDSWPASNFLDFDETITGIGEVQNGLLVFTKYKTYIVTGNSPTTFSKYLVSGEHGCINHNTLQFVNNSLLWLSLDGICSSNGGKVDIITQPKLGRVSIQSINAIVYDRMYFLATPDYILVLDFRYNSCIRRISLQGRLIAFNDVLYIKDTEKTVLSEMFVGENSSMYYKSPIFTDGRFSELKHYKDFYISYSGQITIRIFIDDILVGEKDLDPSKTQFNLKSIDNRNGYGLYFELAGRGEVYEIDYGVVRRENGK